MAVLADEMEGQNDTVLLQTVRVTAFNPSNPALCREAKVILDSGSQRSYVTRSEERDDT